MSIIVETGAGLSNSESYCSVAFADTYHADRGNDAWDNVDNKEAALRKAFDYIQSSYTLAWDGLVLPVRIQQACASLALDASQGDLLPSQDAPVIEETVGPITTRYAAGASQAKKFPAIDRLLAPFITGGDSSGFGAIKLVRA